MIRDEWIGISAPVAEQVQVRRLGRIDYMTTWRAMQTFTALRSPATPDELWAVEHAPVFTQGLNGKSEHLLAPGAIPVIPVDRGGQVTYHGPGQVVIYPLLDLRRLALGIRPLITLLEQMVIALLESYGITAHARADAPGVYVGEAKIASLGLRVRRGCCYHGLSLNVAMDLEPFSRINPCGYAGLRITQLQELGIFCSTSEVRELALNLLIERLGYTAVTATDSLPAAPDQETGHA